MRAKTVGVAGLLLWNYAKDFFGGLTCLFMIEETWSQGSATFLGTQAQSISSEAQN